MGFLGMTLVALKAPSNNTIITEAGTNPSQKVEDPIHSPNKTDSVSKSILIIYIVTNYHGILRRQNEILQCKPAIVPGPESH
jgi:hypothetical protein